MLRRSVAILCLALLAGCLPTPKAIDPNSRINAGVNILPDAVLAAQKYPPSNQPTGNATADLIDVMSDSDQKHFDMIELLRKSGLVPTLQQVGPYTVLAPTDEAFSKLPPGVLDRLMEPANHDRLVAFVKYHLLGGRITMADMLQTNGGLSTLAGSKVVIRGIDNKAMVNDANIIRSDTAASNGVIHWMDTVLIPPL